MKYMIKYPYLRWPKLTSPLSSRLNPESGHSPSSAPPRRDLPLASPALLKLQQSFIPSSSPYRKHDLNSPVRATAAADPPWHRQNWPSRRPRSAPLSSRQTTSRSRAPKSTRSSCCSTPPSPSARDTMFRFEPFYHLGTRIRLPLLSNATP